MNALAISAEEFLKLSIALLTLLGLIGGGIAFAFKFIAVPWLQTNLVKPVSETNTQVTVNNHKSQVPTMLDTIHTMKDKIQHVDQRVSNVDAKVEDVDEKVDTANSTLEIVSKLWERHLESTSDEFKRVWEAINNKKDSHE